SIRKLSNLFLAVVMVVCTFAVYVPAAYAEDTGTAYTSKPQFISSSQTNADTKIAVDGSGNRAVWGTSKGVYLYEHSTKEVTKLSDGVSGLNGTLSRMHVSKDGKYASWLLYDSSSSVVSIVLADLDTLEVETILS